MPSEQDIQLPGKSSHEDGRERLRLFYEAVRETILVHADGIIIDANPPAGALYGCTLDDFIGQPVLKFVAPDSHDIVKRHITEGNDASYTAIGLRADGVTFPLEVVSRNTVFKGRLVRVAVLRDVSERKRAETVIRGRERQLRATFEGALDAMAILDDSGKFMDVNPAACVLFGLPREQMLTRTILDFADAKAEFEPVWATFRDNQNQRGVFRLRRPDKSLRHAEYSATADLLPGRHLAILRDITDRIRLEEQLRQATKMEAIGRLAGGVAHDFNNLLTAITSYSEMLLELLPPGGAERHHAEEISSAADRAAALTRQLLAYSRQQVMTPRVVDLNTVVAGMERMLRRLIGEDIVLATALDPILRRVKADPSQLEQVIMNLTVNARDAMPQGGRLTIATTNSELDEAYAWQHVDVQPGAYIRLSVSDTGIGMSEEVRAHLFEPFFTTKDQGKGTGLGLSTVYGIIKQSEGHIDVASTPGIGTTFHVYLPQVMEPDHIPVRKPINPCVLKGSETVLLVEDDDVVRALARTVLQRQGYKIIEACHGIEALQLCGEYQGELDLLLTDVVMPHMNGRQLYIHVAQQRPGIKVLYMSGYTGGAIAHMGELEAEAAFLQKPFPAEMLARKVREVLDA